MKTDKKVRKNQLLSELKRVAHLCKTGTLTQAQLRKHSKVWPTTIEAHFGTWNHALRLAGLKVTRRKGWTKQEIYNEFVRLEKKCEGRPSYNAFDVGARMNICAVERLFGTYLKAWRWYQGMKAYICSRTKANSAFKHVWAD
jgi:hypothetical protein